MNIYIYIYDILKVLSEVYRAARILWPCHPDQQARNRCKFTMIIIIIIIIIIMIYSLLLLLLIILLLLLLVLLSLLLLVVVVVVILSVLVLYSMGHINMTVIIIIIFFFIIPACGKAELWPSPFVRCSSSMFWRNSGEMLAKSH